MEGFVWGIIPVFLVVSVVLVAQCCKDDEQPVIQPGKDDKETFSDVLDEVARNYQAHVCNTSPDQGSDSSFETSEDSSSV